MYGVAKDTFLSGCLHYNREGNEMKSQFCTVKKNISCVLK